MKWSRTVPFEIHTTIQALAAILLFNHSRIGQFIWFMNGATSLNHYCIHIYIYMLKLQSESDNWTSSVIERPI